MTEYAAKLGDRYRQIGQEAPPWALGLAPTVPFIGKGYGAGSRPRILVYASAENLRGLGDTKGTIYEEDYVRDRHRAAWDGCGGWGIKQGISIEPFDNGGLACAGALLQLWKGHEQPEDYVGLVESLAVGNLSKFVVKRRDGKNVDVRDAEINECSQSYIFADIDVLEPDLVLLAKTLYDEKLRGLITDRYRGAEGRKPNENARVIWMYQYHARTFRACRSALQNLRTSDGDSSLESSLETLKPALAQVPRGSFDPSSGSRMAYFKLLRARYLESENGTRESRASVRP